MTLERAMLVTLNVGGREFCTSVTTLRKVTTISGVERCAICNMQLATCMLLGSVRKADRLTPFTPM